MVGPTAKSPRHLLAPSSAPPNAGLKAMARPYPPSAMSSMSNFGVTPRARAGYQETIPSALDTRGGSVLDAKPLPNPKIIVSRRPPSGGGGGWDKASRRQGLDSGGERKTMSWYMCFFWGGEAHGGVWESGNLGGDTSLGCSLWGFYLFNPILDTTTCFQRTVPCITYGVLCVATNAPPRFVGTAMRGIALIVLTLTVVVKLCMLHHNFAMFLYIGDLPMLQYTPYHFLGHTPTQS